MDDCLGTYDTVASDVRTVGDGLERKEVNIDLLSAVVPGDSSNRPAPHSETYHQAATALLVPTASSSPTDGDGSIDEIIELSSTGSEKSQHPPQGHTLR